MIDPKSIEQLIHDQVDGLLDAETERELNSWLITHVEDNRQQQRVLRTKELLQLLRHDDPGDAFFQNFSAEVHQRLEQEAPRPATRKVARFPHWAKSPIAIGVAASLAMMLTLATIQTIQRNRGNGVHPPPNLASGPGQTEAATSMEDPNSIPFVALEPQLVSDVPVQKLIDLESRFLELDKWFYEDRARSGSYLAPDLTAPVFPERELEPPPVHIDYSF